MFNVIARQTLLEYCRKYPLAKNALLNMYHSLLNSNFKNFNDLKKEYPDVSIVKDDRVVFNIMGNSYRLVVRIVFEYKTMQIKWFGTHREYDKIDVTKISFKK